MVSPDVWVTLGIPSSSDALTIRRAYAAKLRSIDIDGDPAGFMALRSAFERAIEMAERLTPETTPEPEIIAEDDDYDDEGYDDGAWHITPVPDWHMPAEWLQNQRSFDDWRDFLRAMISDHGVWVTWKLFNQALTKGDVALGDQSPLAQFLMTKAIKDETLPQAAFMAMMKTLNLEDVALHSDGWEYLRNNIKKRLDAYHWLDALKAVAAGPQRGKDKNPARAARIFLSPGSRLGGDVILLEAVAKIFIEYHEREIWLQNDLNSIWLKQLEANLLRIKKAKARNGKILTYAVLVFFAVDLLYILIKNLAGF